MDRITRGDALAGAFFLLAAAVYQPLLTDPGGYLTDAARGDGAVLGGAFLEALLVVGVVGTAVCLYPLVRRHGEGLAVAYVAGRVLEAAIIAMGIAAVLASVAMRRDPPDGNDAMRATAAGLAGVHDATFLLGPGLAIGVNTLLLAALVHRAHLVPRAISWLGLVGGPLVFASSTAVLFGAYEQMSP